MERFDVHTVSINNDKLLNESEDLEITAASGAFPESSA